MQVSQGTSVAQVSGHTMYSDRHSIFRYGCNGLNAIFCVPPRERKTVYKQERRRRLSSVLQRSVMQR